MFDNRFNSKKTDPLVEAAKGAMMEGEIRRQAINAVNEEFGVFNRNAVIREHLAAYDARIEEAVKCMKEGKPLSPAQKAKMDVDDDEDIDADDLKILRARKGMNEKKMWQEGVKGNVEIDYSAPDRAAVTSGGKPATPAQTTSAPQDAPMPPKRPANLQELKKPTPKTAMDAYYRAYDSDVRDGGEGKRTSRLGRWKEKHLPGKSARNQKDTGKAEMDDYDRKTVKKSGVLTKASQKDTKAEIKSRLGRHTKPKHLPEETIEEAVSRKHFQQVADLIKGHESQEKRNELATHHAGIFAKQNPRFDHGRFHKAAGSTAHEEPKKMEEAAYSYAAARRGKNIGKKGPDTGFENLAKKAGERYGSKERGEKVAGAILKRIRAKHMKEETLEELSAFGSAFAAARKAGQSTFSMGGKSYTTQMKGEPAAKPATTATPSSSTGGDKGYTSDGGRTVSLKPTADSGTAQAAEPPKAAPAPAAQPKGWSAPKEPSQSDTVAASGAPKASAATSSMDTAGPDTEKMPRVDTGPKLNPNKPGLQESVQVGANRYRIV